MQEAFPDPPAAAAARGAARRLLGVAAAAAVLLGIVVVVVVVVFGAMAPSPHALGVHRVLGPLAAPLRAALAAANARAVSRCASVWELRSAAERRAHKMVFDYVDGGADDEIALRRSRLAFQELEMHYRVLAGNTPGALDLSTDALGKNLALPFFNAPTAGNRMFHRAGESGVAAAAAARRAAYCLSSFATTGLEDVAEAARGAPLKVFQLYVWKDRGLVRDVLQRARHAGFEALALTADVSWFGNRERDARNGFSVPPDYSLRQVAAALRAPGWTLDFLSEEPYTYALLDKDNPAESIAASVNALIDPSFDWDDAAWLVQEWGGHAALKGVVHVDDAKRAVEVGFDSVWVSNHGGRQLETAPAPIDVLPAVRAAVGPDVGVVVDGGVMRGTDIAKALALGADAVGIGKAYLYGLMAGGEAGVGRAFDILSAELERAMGLLGVASVAELKRRGPDLVRRRA